MLSLELPGVARGVKAAQPVFLRCNPIHDEDAILRAFTPMLQRRLIERIVVGRPGVFPTGELNDYRTVDLWPLQGLDIAVKRKGHGGVTGCSIAESATICW